jgi:hypothetical protein
MIDADYALARLDSLIEAGERVLATYNQPGNIDAHDLWYTEAKTVLDTVAPEFAKALGSVAPRVLKSWGGEATPRAIYEFIQGQIEVLRAARGTLLQKANRSTFEAQFVSPDRLEELRQLTSSTFDLSRLIRLCEELNLSYGNHCFHATAMLTRAILDHVPLIFGFRTFAEVANNYSGGKSFRQIAQHLESSARSIADAHLHLPIRAREVLPTAIQVNQSQALDALLGEVVRLLR